MIERFDVYLVVLDPTVGSEIQKVRPCVIISPNEMNRHLGTVIEAPLTSRGKCYPSRVRCRFDDRDGVILLDQIRTVDRARLLRRLGRLQETEQKDVLSALASMFAE